MEDSDEGYIFDDVEDEGEWRSIMIDWVQHLDHEQREFVRTLLDADKL